MKRLPTIHIEEAAHAPFGPSSAKRWLNCSASYRASIGAPNKSSSYAIEGTRGHELASVMLTSIDEGKPARGKHLTPWLDLPNDVLVAVEIYVAHILGLLKKHRKNIRGYGIEQRVRYNDMLYGTADALILVERTLHVIDLKLGAGVVVDVNDNEQLMTYGALALVDRALDGVFDDVDEVMLTIVQPRIEGEAITTQRLPVARLREWIKVLEEGMARALGPNPTYKAGEWCRFCPIKVRCPELMGIASQVQAIEPATLTPLGLSQWLVKASALENWIATLREYAHEQATSGKVIPGWTLRDKRASRTWADEKKVLAIAKRNKLDITETKLLSPPAVEKKFKTIPIKLEGYVQKISSGQNLVRDESVAVPSSAQPSLSTALSNLKRRI